MTFQDYLRKVNDRRRSHRSERFGQVAFNVLYDIKPDLANQIRTTPLDPFYVEDEGRLGKFFAYVEKWWESS